MCEFTVKCPAEGCGQDVSYSDKLCSHMIVRGLEDCDIQERVLALAATETELSLKRVTKFIFAQETAESPGGCSVALYHIFYITDLH